MLRTVEMECAKFECLGFIDKNGAEVDKGRILYYIDDADDCLYFTGEGTELIAKYPRRWDRFKRIGDGVTRFKMNVDTWYYDTVMSKIVKIVE